MSDISENYIPEKYERKSAFSRSSRYDVWRLLFMPGWIRFDEPSNLYEGKKEVLMIRSILLATDGSDTAERAADFAASMALRFKAKVVVLHAFTPEPVDFGPNTMPRNIEYETIEKAKSLVGNVAARLRKMGVVELEEKVVAGPPANVVLGVGETIQPDLIIVGARGSSLWRGAQLGSVSMAVTQRAEAPVLVVK